MNHNLRSITYGKGLPSVKCLLQFLIEQNESNPGDGLITDNVQKGKCLYFNVLSIEIRCICNKYKQENKYPERCAPLSSFPMTHGPWGKNQHHAKRRSARDICSLVFVYSKIVIYQSWTNSLKALQQIFEHPSTHLMIKSQINLIWGQPFDIAADLITVFNVAELTVGDQKYEESFLMTWNKSLGMIHLLDEKVPNYLKIRNDQGKI